MTERMDALYKPPSRFLPPPDARLFNPYVDGLIPTPVDERGLVDARELITVVKSTVEPGYDFHSPFVDDHHLEWPNRWYDSDPDAEVNPQRFRNLMISRMQVPRLFHNWVHLITEPPPVPSEEVMRYRIEAQNVAISLFKKAKTYSMLRKQLLGQAVTFEGEFETDAEIEAKLAIRFEDFEGWYERARQLPKPFQLIDFDQYPARTPEDLVRIRKSIRKYAFPTVATRWIEDPIAA